MSLSELNYVSNKTTVFFSNLNKFWYFAGLPNMCVVEERKNKSKLFLYFHRFIAKYYYIFVLGQLGSIFTQHHLTEKQKSTRLLFNFVNPILLAYYIDLTYHKTKIENLLIMLCITLKKVYNDLDVETKMIRKASIYSIVFSLTVCGTLALYGFEGLMLVYSGYYVKMKCPNFTLLVKTA